MRRLLPVALLALVIVVTVWGLREVARPDRPDRPARREVRQNLIAAFRDADYARTTAHVALGTPTARRYVVEPDFADGAEARGLAPEPEADPPFAWVVGDRADVRLDVVHPAPRQLQLRLAGAVDEPQPLTVLWDGRELGRATLPPDGSEPRLSYDVPAAWQRVGPNDLSLRFGRTAVRRIHADRSAVPVAARLRHVRLLATDGGAPPRPFAPGPVTIEEASGPLRVLRLPPACLMSLVVQVPDADRVLMRWTVHLADLPFDAWLEDEHGEREKLPDGRRTTTPILVEQDLGPWRGRPVRLWLRTAADGEGRVEIGPWLVMAAPDDEPSARAEADAAATAVADTDGTGATAVASREGTAASPSFLVVVLDGLRRDAVSALGHAGWTTPNLDQLIAGGLRCARAVAPSTSSRASLAGLLTGLRPGALGALGRADDDAPVPALGEGAPSLAAGFAAAGWRTALFAGRPSLVGEGVRRRFTHVAPDAAEGGRVEGDRLADAFDAWLRAAPDAPFLAVVAPAEPGPPLDVAESAARAFVAPYAGPITPDLGWAAAFERGDLVLGPADARHLRELYEVRVAAADAVLGRLLVALRWSGREADTVVVVTSTHGLALLEHGRVGAAAGVPSELVDVPLVLQRAGGAAGELSGAATLADVAPTLLRMAGLPVPAAMDGRDLTAPPPTDRGLLTRGTGARAAVAYTVDGWRFVFDSATGVRALFDLTSDAPARDRRGEHPVRAALLEQRLQGALADAVGSDPVEAALRRMRRRP